MSTPTPYDPPRDTRRVSLSEGQRLALDAAKAAEVRAYRTDPDVVALRVEQIRTQVQRLMWAGIALGLCFTMTNVQTFAAAGAVVGSLTWFAAWLLDPTVSLVLLAVLRAEQVTARWQVPTGPWPRVAKWVLLSATYVMNTWSSWAAGSLSGVVLHSVPPLVVVIAAEAVTDLQHALTDCVHRAHTAAVHRADQAQRTEQAARIEQGRHNSVITGTAIHPTFGERSVRVAGERPVDTVGERIGRQSVNPPTVVAGRAGRPAGEPRRKRAPRGSKRRKLLADYLAEARAAWAPELVVTPAWVRQVTACSRGLSSKVAAALNAELPAAPHRTTDRTEPEGNAA